MRPHHVTGDTTYGTLANVVGIEQAGIRAYLPIRDANKREPLFGQEMFTYDAQADLYRCPRGVALTRVAYSYSERITRYQAPTAAYNACPLKAQCTTGKSGRHVQRSFDATSFERVRTYYGTHGYERALRKRKVWMEPLFAEAKPWHRLRRFRLRGLRKVNCEALVMASGQNVKRLLKHGRVGWRPRPDGGATPLIIAIIIRGRSLHRQAEGALVPHPHTAWSTRRSHRDASAYFNSHLKT